MGERLKMENKVVEAVRESVEAMRSSLLEELQELRARVEQMDGKFGSVVLAAVTASANGGSRLLLESDNDIDVGSKS